MPLPQLNDLKIRTKLFAFLIVPIITILYFSITGINLKYQESIRTQKSLDFINMSLIISNMIHELQNERGLSTGFLISNGTKFKSALEKQRLKTDAKRKLFTEMISTKNHQHDYWGLHDLLISLQNKLEQLSTLRTDINTLKNNNSFDNYSTINSIGLEITTHYHALIHDFSLARHIDAFTTLLWLQERSAQERGLLNGIFLSGKLTARQFRELSSYSNEQETLTTHFMNIASHKQQSHFQEILKHPVFQEVSDFQTAAINKASKNDLLNSLQILIGYGGLIHNFKNHVIRGNSIYQQRYKKLYANALRIIEKYRNLKGMSKREIDSLNVIETVFLDYLRLIKTANNLRKNGQTIEEIDAIVRINDQPALKAIEYLHTSVTGLDTSTWWTTSSKRILLIKKVSDVIKADMLMHAKNIRSATTSSLYLNLLLTIVCLILTAYLGYHLIHRVVGGIINIANHMTNMQERGDFSRMIETEGKDEIGEVVNAFNNLIHERKKAEEQLNLAAAVFNNTKEAITVTDADNQILMVNPSFTSITGFELNEVIGKNPSILQSGKHDRAFYKNLWSTLLQKDHWIGEIYNRRKNGEVYPEMLNISAIKNDEDEIIMYIGMFLDISDKKRLEDKQKSLSDQLLQAQKMESLGQLTGGIAHDFNNMLAAILGYTDLAKIHLATTLSDETLDNYLHEIGEAGNRAKHVVEQLLSFSRNSKTTESLPVEIAPLVNESIKMIRPLLPSTIELTPQLPEDGFTVIANPILMHQVIMNLCINSRDAITDYGKISFEVNKVHLDNKACSACHKPISGDFIEICISDTGEGIDKKDIDNLFNPFFTTKELGSQKGMGMGLAMVHGIMHDLNGHIIVESEINKGSKFRLLFTAEKNNDVAGDINTTTINNIKPEGSELMTNNETANIMCVDDEKSLANFMKEILEMNGFNVTAFTESDEALSHFKKHPGEFDLIITDQTMPKLTGSEMAQAMMEINPDIPVVLCSGYSESMNKENAQEIGIKAYLEKPVNMQTLLSAINELKKNT